jgi:hypothetical protein
MEFTEDQRIDLRCEHICELVSCQNGIYALQKLVEWYPDNCIIDDKGKEIILAGPDDDMYFEYDLEDIVFVSRNVKDHGQEYNLFWREGDICCYPADLDDEIVEAMFID